VAMVVELDWNVARRSGDMLVNQLRGRTMRWSLEAFLVL